MKTKPKLDMYTIAKVLGAERRGEVRAASGHFGAMQVVAEIHNNKKESFMPDNRITTPRRTLEQTIHCIQEALSVYDNHEDPRHALDDLNQAKLLIDEVLKTIKPMAKGAAG